MRKTISFLLSFLMIFSMLALGAYAQESSWEGDTGESFGGGSGTAGEPYLITSGAEFAYLASQVNTGINYSGEYFRMTENIDLGSSIWTPIGGGATVTNAFSGVFDGGEHYVENLNIESTDPYCGLFGVVAGATIKNLGILSGSVTVNSGANSPGTAALVGYSAPAGLVMENCYNMASVTVTCDGASQVGGIFGQALKNTPLSFTDCFNAGKVTVTGGAGNGTRVGGIVGYVAASKSTPQSMIRCANMGDVEIVEGGSTKANNARLGNLAGGFIGDQMTVTDCFGSGEMIVGWSGTIAAAKGLLFGYLNVAPISWQSNQAVPYDDVVVAVGNDTLECSTTDIIYQPSTTFISDLFTTVLGFQIRLTDSLADSGIRVVSSIYNALELELDSYGTIITPKDVVHKAYSDDFSKVPLSACLVIESTKSVSESDGSMTIRAAMVQIHSYNYTRDFAAVSYIQYTINGTEVLVYSTYKADTQSACIFDMAVAALNDENTSDILDAYACK